MVLVGDTFVGRPDPDSAFATALYLLKDVDIAFCNLETVVADAKYLAPHDHDHHPRTDEWMFDSYVRAGFNVMNLANNPSTWHGLDPFLRCLESWIRLASCTGAAAAISPKHESLPSSSATVLRSLSSAVPRCATRSRRQPQKTGAVLPTIPSRLSTSPGFGFTMCQALHRSSTLFLIAARTVRLWKRIFAKREKKRT